MAYNTHGIRRTRNIINTSRMIFHVEIYYVCINSTLKLIDVFPLTFFFHFFLLFSFVLLVYIVHFLHGVVLQTWNSKDKLIHFAQQLRWTNLTLPFLRVWCDIGFMCLFTVSKLWTLSTWRWCIDAFQTFRMKSVKFRHAMKWYTWKCTWNTQLQITFLWKGSICF